MKITVVSPFDPTPRESADDHLGGTERALWNLACQLSKRNHDVTMVCSTDAEAGNQRTDGVDIIRVKRRMLLMRDPVAAIARHIPRDSDVVHVPATFPFTTTSVLHHTARLKIPTVLDFHFEPAPGTPLARAAAVVYRHLGPKAYKRADAVIVKSLSYGRSAASLDEIPEWRWRVVPNGIDPETFRPGGQRGDGDYLLFVGRLVPYKGLRYLLDALHLQRRPMPLVVAGDGPLRAVLEAQAKRLHLDVEFLGRVADERLPELYRGARATVLPSCTSQEAFGITLIESMACGTPVVASHLPGVAEVASRGGMTVQPRDAALLASTLEIASQPGALPRGTPLSRRIHDAFAWNTVANRLASVYSEVAGPDRHTLQVGRAVGVKTYAHRFGHPVL